jgi:peroxiredoxin
VTLARFAIAVGAAALIGLMFHGFSGTSNQVRAASVKPGSERHEAPDFTLKDAEGKTVHLSDYKGKVVLLDFWATWCGPCRIEIPWFMEMQRKNRDKGFEVLGVSMDDEGWDVVRPFLKELSINYRVMIGNDATASEYGGVDSLPTTFLIDREGKIAAVHVGLAAKKDFEDGVNELLDLKTQANAKTGVLLPLSPLPVRAR